jgi:hypothetical protein
LAEHLLDFHEFIRERHIVHEDVKIKLFIFSLKGAALDWCRSLPTASIISLKVFHDAFNLFCKDDFSADALFPECCHEYNLFCQINGHEKYDCAEKYVVEEDTFHKDPKVLDDLHFDIKFVDTIDIISNVPVVSNSHKNQVFSFEISDKNEQMDRLACDRFESTVDVEGSPHFPDLQIRGSCSNHKEQGDIFPDLFQDFIVDPAIQEASSLSLGAYLDTPIFDQYSDEEEDVKACEDLLFTQISSSSSFQQRDDKKCVHAVIDACYESVAQKSNEDLFSFDMSCKDIIVGEEIVSYDEPTYHHDGFRLQRYGEGEKKGSDQLLNVSDKKCTGIFGVSSQLLFNMLISKVF